jgi:hypothetical protein
LSDINCDSKYPDLKYKQLHGPGAAKMCNSETGAFGCKILTHELIRGFLAKVNTSVTEQVNKYSKKVKITTSAYSAAHPPTEQ